MIALVVFGRQDHLAAVRRQLRRQPVVALLGPRQVGKTTLARAIADAAASPVTRFDLEHPADLARLSDEATALQDLRGLVVIDEVQRRPELFPFLRVLADRSRRPASFLVLGSASPHLLKQSSETLAGRVTYHELDGLGLSDIRVSQWRRLWLRGGYPRSFLARSDAESGAWRADLRRTYVEQDLPALGPGYPARTIERVWEMLAHCHGQIWNGAEIARAFGVSHTTSRRHLDLLADTFMIRLLSPWSENIGKRQVKSPKLYVRDTGLLHHLLGIGTQDELVRHPRVGASFEGFAIDAVIRRLGADRRECYFWATHQGAELDLFVVRGRQRWGFEIKHTVAPQATKSMHIAMQDLGLNRLDVIHIGPNTYPLARNIRAVAFDRLQMDLTPLS
ncbi:MAG: ATP-binding protein [Acidimicrobiia bacterium]|nr:ATP-binding protein [Acidimicrobiia bacterium]